MLFLGKSETEGKNILKRGAVYLLFLICLLLVCSCAGPGSSPETHSAEPSGGAAAAQERNETAENEPPQATKPADEGSSVISSEIFKESLSRNYDPSVIKDIFNRDDKDYIYYAENIGRYLKASGDLTGELFRSLRAAGKETGYDVDIHIVPPDAQMMMALADSYDRYEDMSFDMLPVSISEKSGSIQADIDFSDIIGVFTKASAGDPEKYLNMRVKYGYMLTVYDAKGNILSGEQDAADIPEWMFPLPRFTRFRDTWFANRDGGRRRHLGTDISAPEGTEIYSCTDAEVINVENGRLAGNCVLTRDGYGNEYLYCHMVEVSDFLAVGQKLKAGDLVGHVGNTGNSAVNHLHLSVLLQDGRHLHTFPYLKEAWDNKRVKKQH